MKSKSGERTLLASVLMSAPGPLVLGLALLFGRSSTQLADFIRRTAELAAIILSLVIYRILHRHGDVDKGRKERLEQTANLSVGIAMCLSGAAILFIAIFSSSAEKGNVIPGLVIAILGVITNSWFWFRYSRLNREMHDAILAVQSRLYRAKSLVDGCVVIVLSVVAIAPDAPSTRYVDLIGSVVVSAYLIVSGVLTIRGGNPVVVLEEIPDEADEPLKIPNAKSPSEAD